MGQYHMLVNFTKKEFVDPHKFGNGLKLKEQVNWEHAFSNITHYLIAKCTGRGGGDFNTEMAGRWGGDRISLVGDYAEREDFPFLTEQEYMDMKASVWGPPIKQPRDSKGRFLSKKNVTGDYVDISDRLVYSIEEEFSIKYSGTGWRNVEPVFIDRK